MFAGHHGLDNLVLIVDNNDMQASGRTQDILSVEPVVEKFESFGFAARRVDGNDVQQLLDVFAEARSTRGKPFAVIAETRLFNGTPGLKAKYPKVHFLRAGAEEMATAIGELDREYEARLR
jgi:transketolase